ncbi:tetraacyldisaccharide 4'-kinase [Ramlibacter sp. 2FC]|uniref:tetraacyldisaccharide 4'-kinase n=1 Tax=Ramlibacter sp. 2FC TaxID=2502188 RepID=UPI0010F7C9CB|nr:tetraacyldisaccharide 4'-kinase [Ramlibacter sp. 2FC]
MPGFSLERTLLAAWTRRGLLAWALWPLSLLYGALAALRRSLYRLGLRRATRLPVPVIVVGNLVAGGGGKTPTVIALAQHLRARGLRPGVVSRGHGRQGHNCREVLADSAAQEVGDEPLLIRQTCEVPVFVAARRVEAAQALLARHPATDLLVCDDGLQHLALARDIEVCVFDERGTGNGWLLPAGPLREPWPRAVDLVLHTGRRAFAAGYGAERALAAYARRADGSRVALAELRAQPVLALAGIARPEAFFAMLREQGLNLAQAQALPDHFDFEGWTPPPGWQGEILCTEKDAVKLWPQYPGALAVPLVFAPEPAFLAALDRALDALRVPRQAASLSSADGHQTT